MPRQSHAQVPIKYHKRGLQCKREVLWGVPTQLVIINDTEKRRKEAFREARCSYETTLYNKGMKTMSIPSAKEYIRTQQQNWERKKRLGLKLIADVVDVLHCSQKRAIRLLTGSAVFKGRKGRGRTYRDAEIEVIRALWRELGGLCAPYLHADLARFMRDYQELHHVPQDVAERVLRMSVSTIARAIRGQERSNSVWSKPRNKRSGKNAIRALVPIESGEDRPAHEIPPGDIQADSVALCGGNLSGDFFWVSTTVDRRLQWIEARPSFNLCATNYLPALEGNAFRPACSRQTPPHRQRQ